MTYLIHAVFTVLIIMYFYINRRIVDRQLVILFGKYRLDENMNKKQFFIWVLDMITGLFTSSALLALPPFVLCCLLWFPRYLVKSYDMTFDIVLIGVIVFTLITSVGGVFFMLFYPKLVRIGRIIGLTTLVEVKPGNRK